jgi:hypothetical protein
MSAQILLISLCLSSSADQPPEDVLFRNWEREQAHIRTLAIEFELERYDPLFNERVRFDGTFKLRRSPRGAVLARYEVKPIGKSGSHMVGLLRGQTAYLLLPAEKTAGKINLAGQDVIQYLGSWFNPFALLIDKKHTERELRLKISKQDEWYTYLDVERKRSGWFPVGLLRGRVVLSLRASDAVPKDMPRELWYADLGGVEYKYYIRNWRVNAPDGPREDAFENPDTFLGWQVTEWPSKLSIEGIFGDRGHP